MVSFSCLTCNDNQTKNITLEMTVHESVYYTKSNINFSVLFSTTLITQHSNDSNLRSSVVLTHVVVLLH